MIDLRANDAVGDIIEEYSMRGIDLKKIALVIDNISNGIDSFYEDGKYCDRLRLALDKEFCREI